MALPIQITFRDVVRSAGVEDDIRKRAKRLAELYEGVQSCRIMVDAPHRSQQTGRRYHVRIDMTVPGGELVVNRDPQQDASHEDVLVAVRDAFSAAERQLHSFMGRRR